MLIQENFTLKHAKMTLDENDSKKIFDINLIVKELCADPGPKEKYLILDMSTVLTHNYIIKNQKKGNLSRFLYLSIVCV